MTERLAFIVNGASGSGRGAKVWAAVERELSRRGVRYAAAATSSSGHATALAQRMARDGGYASIVAVGGDGTVHEVVAGLLGSNVPLGHIPAGSGNDFARCLRLPAGPSEAVDALIAGHTVAIDVGRANGRPFVNSFGAGFDGEVGRIANRAQWKRSMNALGLGALAYPFAVLAALGAYRPARVGIEVDGVPREFEGVWLAVAANMPAFGGGMRICPEASPTDGALDVCVVHGLSRWRLLRYFPRLYRGTHLDLPYVTMLRGREVRVRSDRRLYGQADGEGADAGDATISVAPAGLRVVVPAKV
ncbi:diacylglycerol kinase family protein [Paenibacillus sp.]|uniref:diacylglycerol/lipid kinase family protein n=1 Tax=Paenibacillus sp. TaxID=58172 RepID=UPI002D3DA4C0|nr:diacylglycerol kinase family protein [Paenibacillus sp.]HZG57001.1 diacylglycerol kinase family protein [Paenibacillus sp.]